MSIQAQVVKDIGSIEPGKMFTYQILSAWKTSPGSTVKAMSRLVKTGKIRLYL